MWGASRRSGDSRSGVQAGLIPWQGGKSLTWNVTVVSTLADSYLHSTSRSAGSAAEAASVRKESKYLTLTSDLIFQPIAMETHGPLNASALNFLSEVGRKTAKYSNLSSQHTFYPIAVETLGPLNEDARLLLSDLGRRISAASGDVREVSFLFQRISVVVQRFNAVLLHKVLLRTTSRNKCHFSEFFLPFLTTCGFVLVGLK